MAKKVAAKIATQIGSAKGVVQASTENYLAGKPASGGAPTVTAKTVADHLAAKLNAKLNYSKPGTHFFVLYIQWCPDLVYPDLVDCRDLVD